MRRTLPLVLALMAVVAPCASGQEPEERIGPPPVQYNFAPPGARSLAMGASFIGLADDATASESNPAGLTILTRPEFSAHFRYTVFDNEVPNTVTLEEDFSTFTSRVGSPSFFSVVYPWRKAAVSVYYQRSADYRLSSLFDDYLGEDLYDIDRVDLLFRSENVGLSGAVKLGDKISLGASVRGSRMRVDSNQGYTLTAANPSFVQIDRYKEYADLDESKVEVTYNAGLLVTPTPKFSLGAVYKKGTDFDFTQTSSITFGDFFGEEEETRSQPLRFTLPDVFGGGIAVRPTDRLTILVDVVQIQYSQADVGQQALNLYQRYGGGLEDENVYEALEDATEIHAGIEYTWTRGSDWIFSLRGGYYSDPDHDGLSNLDSKQDHVTFGGGVVVKNKLQVDGAVNIADAIKEGLISFVVRF